LRPLGPRRHPDDDIDCINITHDHRIGADGGVVTDPHPTQDRGSRPDDDACTHVRILVCGVPAIPIALAQRDSVKESAILSNDRAATDNDPLRMPQHQTWTNSATHDEFGTRHSEIEERHRVRESVVASSL
jgi:hypothetical protein